jgi:hypothetical protein
VPFDEDASEVPMTTIDQDHAAPPANDEPRPRSRTKDQRYPVLARGTSVPRRGLACVALALLASLSSHAQAGVPHLPGTLANPGFEGQPMKGAYFFAGEWRRGRTFYEGPTPGELLTPSSNDCLYTIFPSDGITHLGWSERQDKRDHPVDLMLAAGVNVVNMSYWGPPNTDRWAFWAPMQTATGAHNELFDAAVGKPLLIAPAIESSATTIGAHPHDPDARTAKMTDGRTHLGHKADHAVDLEAGALVGVTVQDADDGDTTTSIEALIEAAEQVRSGPARRRCIEEVVGDKGYHSNQSLVDLETVGVASTSPNRIGATELEEQRS